MPNPTVDDVTESDRKRKTERLTKTRLKRLQVVFFTNYSQICLLLELRFYKTDVRNALD